MITCNGCGTPRDGEDVVQWRCEACRKQARPAAEQRTETPRSDDEVSGIRKHDYDLAISWLDEHSGWGRARASVLVDLITRVRAEERAACRATCQRIDAENQARDGMAGHGAWECAEAIRGAAAELPKTETRTNNEAVVKAWLEGVARSGMQKQRVAACTLIDTIAWSTVSSSTVRTSNFK